MSPTPTFRTRAFRALAACAAWLGVVASASPGHAAIVERIVAVVGERPILLSDLRHRARPDIARIMTTVPEASAQTAELQKLYPQVLNRMIDDRLEEQAADKAHVTVNSEEIDVALKDVAARAHLTVKDVLSEARRVGLSEQDYRDELRRQLLEGKLVQVRVRGRVRVTEQDARAAYARFLRELGNENLVDVRILALRVDAGSTKEQIDARIAFAERIAKEARNGADFCGLVNEHSDDVQSRPTCGSRGPQPANAIIPPIAEAIRTMKAKDVSDPIRIGDEAILVVQLAAEPSTPGFEDVKDQMLNRAYGEAMQTQLKAWLAELRRGVYVDIRL
ncbi:MAG: SurA N-terminal domain-containing protein [Polyangiaceae bacterium]